MPTALALSPHLDDAVFSCGGTLALMVGAGWRVVMATAFTRSVVPAQGFALACQLDKGLSPEMDYMAIRRAEDRAAATILGIEDVRWLDLLEAPHRGYGSAPALFAGVRDNDDVWQDLRAPFERLRDELRPDLVLASQGLGDHVDHRQLIRAALEVFPPPDMAFYRDTPYAIRNPEAACRVTLPDLREHAVRIGAALSQKVAASAAYGSQIGFQFGGAAGVEAALRAFASAEGKGAPAERFMSASAFAPGSLEAATL